MIIHVILRKSFKFRMGKKAYTRSPVNFASLQFFELFNGASHDAEGQLMVPGGQFMAENDNS